MSFLPDNPPRPAAPSPNFSTPPSPPRRAFSLRTLFLLILLVLIGPCMIVEIPQEIGRWKLAQAIELRAGGKKDAAYDTLAEAMRRFPNNPSLFLQRADWRLEDGQKEEAQADADRMLELGGNTQRWLMLHSSFLQYAGKFAEAVQDWKELDKLSERNGNPARSTALNGLAYAQALAQKDLDEAVANANRALELSPGNPAILDTRGYLLYLTKDYAAALKDMDAAIAGVEELTGALKPREQRPPLESILRASIRTRFESETSDPYRTTAVLHYHRALVLRALGREKEAESDLDRVRQLIGQEPDETLF
jgi:tetratricopeptide (TPR) repeat protein